MPRSTSPIFPPIATLSESDFSDFETESCSSIPSSPLSPDFMSGFLDNKDRFGDPNNNQIERRNDARRDERCSKASSHDNGRNFERDVRFDVCETDRFSGPEATPVVRVVRLPEPKIGRCDAVPTQRDIVAYGTGGTKERNSNLNSVDLNGYRFINHGIKTPDRGASGSREGMSLKEYRFRHYDVKVAPSDATAPSMHTEPDVFSLPSNPVSDQPHRRARARSFTYEPTISRCVKPECSKHFKTLDEVVAHMPLHRGEFGAKDSVRCAWPDCNWTSNMVGNAKRHFLVIKHKEKGYACDECSEMYTRKDALKRHQIRKHINQTDEEAALDGMMMLLKDAEDA
ncbi:uncharacterized protein EV420DRAFT_1483475 [Desarmillaria tabescens]|uniref:C2H2-type domain-containing protein n=1 Tax=Armillaria tabescens TaxID=1929756 RepID=A0AA39JXK8_ARMTA|nr:uncharacterized protein EV420DRAFT_1483475 [Desarmillaria tabescens]KAK0448468.1 hypothetical protein EV420DRAFT_1483475 [Desarmillaria tabescens]